MKNKIRLALMRASPRFDNLDANFEVFVQAVKLAAQKSADVLITPECWLDGYTSKQKGSTRARLRKIAQPLETSPYLREVSRLARESRMYICFGFTSLERKLPYNTAGLWDPKGQRVGVYHKTHLQKHDLQYGRGNSLPVFATPWGPVGMMICADRRWPETVRVLRLQGARLILNPTYGFYGYWFNGLNEAMMRTRAYESQCFIAFTHPKQGLVIGPDGQIVAKAEDPKDKERFSARVLTCDLDLTRSEAEIDNHLRDRRPDLYGPITDQRIRSRKRALGLKAAQ